MFLGLVTLLASLYFRTDFVVLSAPVFLALWMAKKIELYQAIVLSLLAVGSVLTINYFAGDYGIKMLYYRNFIGAPSAPGEMAIAFSARDYFKAFRSGLTSAAEGFLIPFVLLGILGWIYSSRLRIVAVVATVYMLLHFLLLPNWVERWFGVFYLAMVLCAGATAGTGSSVRLANQDAT